MIGNKTAKGWSLLGLCFLLTTLLAACGENPTNPPAPTIALPTNVAATPTKAPVKGEITVWSWDIAAQGLESNVAGFTRLYPEVKVKVEAINRQDMYDKLTAGLTAGGVGLPDVVTIETERLEAFSGKFPEGLMNLTERAAKYEKDFDPLRWDRSYLKGRVRAMPWDVAPAGLFYRVDLFQKAGVNPATIETWDDFIEAGKKIQAANPGVKLLAIDPLRDDTLFRLMLNQQGSFYFNKDGKISLASPEAVNAMTVIQKLQTAGLLLTVDGHTGLVNANKNGQVAAQPAGSAWSGTLTQSMPEMSGKWDVMLLPALTKGGNRATGLGGSVLAVPSKTKNVEAAWAFVEYSLATKDGQNNIFKNFGMLPAYQPAYSDPFYTTPQPYFNNKPVWKTLLDELPQVKPVVYTIDYPVAQSVSLEAQNEVLKGADPKTALETAADELKQKVGRDLEGTPAVK